MTTTENKQTEESWVKQDWIYIKTALILGFFTAIEVFTYFESVHNAPEWLMVLTLSFLMVVKGFGFHMAFLFESMFEMFTILLEKTC